MKYSGRLLRLHADRLGAPELGAPFLRAQGLIRKERIA